ADVNPAAESLEKKYQMKRFVTDYRELLPVVDAVVVCVPTHLHSAIAVDALAAGKHVFLEKPLARTMDQAEAIAAAAAKSKAALQVGFVRRFDQAWLGWRDTILANSIGRP